MQNEQCFQSPLLFQLFCSQTHYSHTFSYGTYITPPDLVHKCMYITRRVLSLAFFRRQLSVEFNVSHLMLQPKYDTKYIALLVIGPTTDKKPRARYSTKDEH